MSRRHHNDYDDEDDDEYEDGGKNSHHDAFQLEESEAALLSGLEKKRAQSKPTADGFRAAMKGERAPLGNASLGIAFEEGSSSSVNHNGDDIVAAIASPGNNDPGRPPRFSGKLKFRQVANKVKRMNTASNLVKQMKGNRNPQSNKHSRVASILASIDDDDDSGVGADLGFGSATVSPSTFTRSRTVSQGGDHNILSSPNQRAPPTRERSFSQHTPTRERAFSSVHRRTSSVMNETLHAGTLGELMMDIHADDFEDLPLDQSHNFNEGTPTGTNNERTDNDHLQAQTWINYGAADESLPLLDSELPHGGDPGDDGLYMSGPSFSKESDGFEKSSPPRFEWFRSSVYWLLDFGAYACQWTAYHVLHSTLIIALMCSIAAWIVYYHMNNPEFDFMPGQAKLSWWCNFVARQCVVLELSRITQWIIVDWFALSTPWGPKILGPLTIIVLVQSKSGPFVVTTWGLLGSMLLHGDNSFQVHWLSWTGLEIYSEDADSGNYILTSDKYTRFLIVLILLGIATTAKNTAMTLYFGKKNFELYKEKLEKILKEIILISEVADLAEEADSLPDRPKTPDLVTEQSQAFNKSAHSSTSSLHDTNDAPFYMPGGKNLVDNAKSKGRQSTGAHIRWRSVDFGKDKDSVKDDASASSSSSSGSNSSSDSSTASSTTDEEERLRKVERRGFLSQSKRNNTGLSTANIPIKKLLDQWKDPLNKADNTMSASIHDIYKFRKALAYMDMVRPFDESFGPASTRDECITSAQIVYGKLLKISPTEHALSFEVLASLCYRDDGTRSTDRFRAMKRLFRPGKGNQLGMIAFVQSCDNVYKKLRYFRASVGNSSVIDGVLETIINAAFRLGMTVVLLSIMEFNPWPLLVSMSTLMVTFAFAVGPSIAKMIEGILLIVMQRPYDIGDRILIADTPGIAVIEDEAAGGWFVEDISLFTTTLRFAASNAVASVGNGSISDTRITNCARSTNAIVNVVLKLHIRMHRKNRVRLFRESVEQYIADHPRSWEAMIAFRCGEIDADNEAVTYTICCRSRSNWQVAGRVLDDRSLLHRHCEKLAAKMHVTYESPKTRQIVYYGGALENGSMHGYKSDILDGTNVSRGNPNFMPFGKGAPVPPTADAAERNVGKAQGSDQFPHDPKGANSKFLQMVKESM